MKAYKGRIDHAIGGSSFQTTQALQR